MRRITTRARSAGAAVGCLLIFSWLPFSPARALGADPGQVGPAFTLLTGTALNLSAPLTIRQVGDPELHWTAHYDTRPFRFPFYYLLRIALLRGRSAWELQLIHHKLYLTNPVPEVQHLEITHGFNVLTLNRMWRTRRTSLRAGAGVVVPHVEATVRGRDAGTRHGLLNAGYRFTGPSFILGLGRSLPLRSGFAVAAEAQGVIGCARITVSSGKISTCNAGIHALFGLTWSPGGGGPHVPRCTAWQCGMRSHRKKLTGWRRFDVTALGRSRASTSARRVP
jgi:hypothetical protein